MSYTRGITCQITAFQVDEPPSVPGSDPEPWLAIATAHVYDPDVSTPLTPAQAILAGETMRVIDGRASAATEAVAMMLALKALLFQLTAKGFSANTDVKIG